MTWFFRCGFVPADSHYQPDAVNLEWHGRVVFTEE